MKFAYADPPYLGCGRKHYGKLHADAGVYDTVEGHAALIERLVQDFPDGWALSMTSTSLRTFLPLCPADVRVGAWVKPFAVFKPGVNPGYAWEPVIFGGGRKLGRDVPTVRDWCSVGAMMRNYPGTVRVPGAKPDLFCQWVFAMLGAQKGDELVDLFPGSGAVGKAWADFQSRML
jgi:hypothetical protein